GGRQQVQGDDRRLRRSIPSRNRRRAPRRCIRRELRCFAQGFDRGRRKGDLEGEESIYAKGPVRPVFIANPREPPYAVTATERATRGTRIVSKPVREAFCLRCLSLLRAGDVGHSPG